MRIAQTILVVVLIACLSPIAFAQSNDGAPPAGVIGKVPGVSVTAPPPASAGDGSSEIGGYLGDGTPVRVRHVPYPPVPRVISMKLLAPGVGWALATRHLFITRNDDNNWTDITPKGMGVQSQERICDVFFLDIQHVWVLVATESERPVFDLVSSTDAGTNWTMKRVALPPDLGLLSSSGRIAFADLQHGWMILDMATSSAFSAGTLLVTSDGGQTWTVPPEIPSGQGPMLLLTSAIGWIVGDGESEVLNVTWDGAKTWQTVSLPPPKEAGPSSYSAADAPVFLNRKEGFVSVTYGNDQGSYAVLFATDDGGHNWKPDRILANLESIGMGQHLPSTIVDSLWITAAVRGSAPTITALPSGARVRAAQDSASSFSGYFRPDELSFASASDGWIVVGDGQLLSTTDGGATWADITPKITRPKP